MSDPLLDSPLVLSIGWALVHFIWQGTLIGGPRSCSGRCVKLPQPSVTSSHASASH